MSNAERRLPLAEAQLIAHDLVTLLRPACDRIEIAGSIRRQKDDIGDVEIVCIPKTMEQFTAADMFGDEPKPLLTNMLDELCAGLVLRGMLKYRLNKNGGKSWGHDLKWGMFQDFAVDIYSATAETWAVTLAIRTGSAEFSHKLVTPRAVGGFCPGHLVFKGWRVRRRDDGMAYDTPEEADVFHVLGIGYPQPWLRTDTYQPVQVAAHV